MWAFLLGQLSKEKKLKSFFAGTDLGNKTISDNDNVPWKSENKKGMSGIPYHHSFWLLLFQHLLLAYLLWLHFFSEHKKLLVFVIFYTEKANNKNSFHVPCIAWRKNMPGVISALLAGPQLCIQEFSNDKQTAGVQKVVYHSRKWWNFLQERKYIFKTGTDTCWK